MTTESLRKSSGLDSTHLRFLRVAYWAFVSALFWVVLSVVPHALAAEDDSGFIVFRSSNPTIWPIGLRLLPGARLSLKAGEYIEGVDSNEKKLVLKGPGDESIPSSGRVTENIGLLQRLLSIPDLVTKGALPRGPVNSAPMDPLVIDVTEGGGQCLSSTGGHLLWQPGSPVGSVRGRLSLPGKSVWITWNREATTVDWPSAMPLASGLLYTLEIPSLHIVRTFHVIVIPNLSKSKGLAAATLLLENGCRPQAFRMLEALPSSLGSRE